MKKRIVLLGPPASGKGTQAEMITAKYHFPIASPGSILRDEKRAGTKLGIEADALTKEGQLLPDQLITDLVRAWLEKCDSNFIFDGFPRTIGQADLLDNMLTKRNTPLEVVLALEVDFNVIQERVTKRMMCNQCGRIISLGLHVKRADSPCPSCGGTLLRRNDDTLETLKQRMTEYREKTEPLIPYYSQRGLLARVNAEEPVDAVFAAITQILEK